MNIKLYIGAHKTATTHIQNILANSRESLSDHGISLSIPSDIRPKWLPLLNKYIEAESDETLEKIRKISPSTESWIIAEENIPGVSKEFKTKSGIYTSLEKRLTSIKKAYPDAKIDVFFSIRSYDSFYRSAYLEVVRNNGYFPFDEFYDANRFKDNSWLSVIESFTNVFDQKHVYLWRYEDLSQLLPVILNNLTSLPTDFALKMIADYEIKITRPSISAKTLDLLSSSLVNSKSESIELLEQLNKRYPANQHNGYYQPFDLETINTFKNDYKLDSQSILEQYPSINFLGA